VTQKLLMHPGDDFFFLIVKKKWAIKPWKNMEET
jgi:hypothetical protein